MELADKVVVVTGGAQGIGRGLCERFREEGVRGLVVADLDAEGAARTAREVDGLAVTTDVAQRDDMVGLVGRCLDEFGVVDLFCSNAGVAYSDGPGGTVASAPEELWEKSWRINVLSHVHAVHACLPAMHRQGGGYFLITVSAAGLLSQIGSGPYSATKHAAIGFAEALAITHGDEDIGVSVLCPQAVDTSLLDGLEDGGVAALDGIMSPAEIADHVVMGLGEERFLILPHPQVLTYLQRKTADYDRWLKGMRRLRERFIPEST